jgi:hypothetical protein
MTKAELQILDGYIKNKFTPPLSDIELLRFKQKRCIDCGKWVHNWCEEVPMCCACDAKYLGLCMEAREVPWQTYPSEE